MSNKTSDKNVANDSVIAHKFAVMQQQINEKDKRIQELEKQLQKYYNGELYTAKQLKNLENNQRKYFINKQEVIDKLERHKFAYEEFSKEYNNKHYEDDEVRARDFYMIVAEDRIVQVLQELLEGEK